MKLKILVCLLIVCFVALPAVVSEASYSSKDLLKQGLLGAGSGAAASAASGGNAGTGALVGAGVNVLGGALLDSLTEEPAYKYQDTRRQPATYSQQQPTYREQQSYPQPKDAYSTGYEDGYSNGYKAGYTAGYKEGLKEAYKQE